MQASVDGSNGQIADVFNIVQVLPLLSSCAARLVSMLTEQPKGRQICQVMHFQ